MSFCSKCGAPVEPDAKYCRMCGSPVTGEPAGETIGRDIGETVGRDVEKAIRESMTVERIPEYALINSIFGGLVVILIGAVLYLTATHAFEWLKWTNFWALFLLGLGILLLLKGLAELVIPAARRSALGDMNGGVILGIIGGALTYIFSGGDIGDKWPFIIVIIGVVVIAGAIVSYVFRK